MSILWVDFETRSRCDLKARGVYNYALDFSTEVLCMSYAFDDEEVRTWTPDMGQWPDEVYEHTGQIRAHNAAFERLIFKHVLAGEFDDEQFYCTATQARANCMPGALGDVTRFCGVDQKKDYRGAQLIRWLCIPDKNGNFNSNRELMQELVDYCAQDVRAMRAASKAMRELTEEELYDYHVNERINDRGILVDVPLCLAAVDYAKQIAKNPAVLYAINPIHAVHLIRDQGFGIFWAFGSIVLAVTGAEALYADMGHFGRRPIRAAWLSLVMPGLLLNYFGQGALLLGMPEAAQTPFFLMAPENFRLPLVILATLATVIAINWAFKVSVEVVMTPVTYAVVGWLKRREQEDFYDTKTNFTPFSLED